MGHCGDGGPTNWVNWGTARESINPHLSRLARTKIGSRFPVDTSTLLASRRMALSGAGGITHGVKWETARHSINFHPSRLAPKALGSRLQRAHSTSALVLSRM